MTSEATSTKQPELNDGERCVLLLDALSHSFNYHRVEVEVIDRQTISLEIENEQLTGIAFPGMMSQNLDIAVCKISRWTTFDEDDTKQFLPEDSSFVDKIETLVRVDNKPWHTTAWIMEVRFEEKN